MKSIYVHGKTWFDKVNSNSYFSARVEIDGEEIARLPFQYGYGDQYLYETQRVLQEMGLLTLGERASLRSQLERVQGKPVLYTVLEPALKRDVSGWGKPWEVTK